jgi:hypothetical protein
MTSRSGQTKNVTRNDQRKVKKKHPTPMKLTTAPDARVHMRVQVMSNHTENHKHAVSVWLKPIRVQLATLKCGQYVVRRYAR